jgi:hypothetical protein
MDAEQRRAKLHLLLSVIAGERVADTRTLEGLGYDLCRLSYAGTPTTSEIKEAAVNQLVDLLA